MEVGVLNIYPVLLGCYGHYGSYLAWVVSPVTVHKIWQQYSGRYNDNMQSEVQIDIYLKIPLPLPCSLQWITAVKIDGQIFQIKNKHM